MIHPRIIHRILGILLLIEAGVLLLCSLLPVYYGEKDFFAFIMASLITVCFGIVFFIMGKNSGGMENVITRRDGYIVVTVSWILFSLFGALPYYISGHIPSFTDAFFETMSGFTTTGTTVIQDIEALPTDCSSGAALHNG